MTNEQTTTSNQSSVIGKLVHGVTIGDKSYTEFEIEPIKSMGQLFDAEAEADPKKSIQFEAALIGQQLKRIGDYTGPFNLVFMRMLKLADYNKLREAQRQLEVNSDLGNEQESD